MNSLGQRTQRTSAWWAVGSALLSVMLTLVGTPQDVLAQWATSGNDIYNSNTGNVGIGTTGPTDKVHVIGDIRIPTGNKFFFETSGSNNALFRDSVTGASVLTTPTEIRFNKGDGTRYVTIIDGGNVGIGTTSPIGKLDVGSLGNAHFIFDDEYGNGSNRYNYGIKINRYGFGLPGNRAYWGIVSDYTNRDLNFITQSGLADDAQFTNAATNVMTLAANGNVGIGTTSPTSQLTLGLSGGGDGVISRGTSDGSDTGRLSLASGGTIGADRGAYIELLGNEYGIPSIRGTVGITAGGSTGEIGFSTGFVGNRMVIKNDGKVGIGVSDPYALFTIRSWNMGTTPTLAIMPSSAQTANIIDIYDPLTQQLTSVLNSAGNLGIGTTSPSAKLHVKDTAASAIQMRIEHVSVSEYARIIFANAGLDMGYLRTLGGQMELFSQQNVPVLFGTNNAERMRIAADGNVGIGTTSPTTKLHVVGDVTVTGNIAAKYQDVAEWVPAPRPLAAGTVVVLDSQQSNRVLPSAQPYDMRVAGVVSDTPGLLLGEAGADKVKVATTGRVKAKVDATKKPIQVGDLLVTSEKAGLAMVSEPTELNGRKFHQPGTILGKALEPLKEGEGEILVLLSLQ